MEFENFREGDSVVLISKKGFHKDCKLSLGDTGVVQKIQYDPLLIYVCFDKDKNQLYVFERKYLSCLKKLNTEFQILKKEEAETEKLEHELALAQLEIQKLKKAIRILVDSEE